MAPMGLFFTRNDLDLGLVLDNFGLVPLEESLLRTETYKSQCRIVWCCVDQEQGRSEVAISMLGVLPGQT